MCGQCGRPLVEIDNYGERLQDRAACSHGMPHRARMGLPPEMWMGLRWEYAYAPRVLGTREKVIVGSMGPKATRRMSRGIEACLTECPLPFRAYWGNVEALMPLHLPIVFPAFGLRLRTTASQPCSGSGMIDRASGNAGLVGHCAPVSRLGSGPRREGCKPGLDTGALVVGLFSVLMLYDLQSRMTTFRERVAWVYRSYFSAGERNAANLVPHTFWWDLSICLFLMAACIAGMLTVLAVIHTERIPTFMP